MSWPTVKLDEVADVKIGPFGSLLHKNDYLEGGVPLVNPMHIEDGKIVPDRRHAISPEKANQLTNYRMAEGDVILARRGEMGRCAVVSGVADGYMCGTGSLIVRPKPSLSAKFLSLLLSSREMARTLERASLGTTMPNLNREIVSNIQLPLPPLDEQRRIAAILDHASALRLKRSASERNLGTLDQAMFAWIFGPPADLLNRWPTAPLGRLLDFLTSGSRGWARHYSDTGSAFLRIQNVGRNAMLLDDLARVDAPNTAEAKRTRVAPRDVLLSITADLGRTAVVPDTLGDAYINQHLAILRCSSLDATYLSTFLSSPIGQRQLLGRNRQGVKAGLNFDDVRSVSVAIPPIELQDKFSVAMRQLDVMRFRQSKASGEERNLFTSLQSRAFRGEL